jgi:hypothetical protein
MAAAIITVTAEVRAKHLQIYQDMVDAMEKTIDLCNDPDNQTAEQAAACFDFYMRSANFLERKLATTRVEEPQAAAAAAACPVAQMEALLAGPPAPQGPIPSIEELEGRLEALRQDPAPAAPAELTPEQRLALFLNPNGMSARATMLAAACAPHSK